MKTANIGTRLPLLALLGGMTLPVLALELALVLMLALPEPDGIVAELTIVMKDNATVLLVCLIRLR